MRCEKPLSRNNASGVCRACMPLVPGSNNRFPVRSDEDIVAAILAGVSTIKALSNALGQSYNNKTNLIRRLERLESEDRITITRRANRHGGWILKGA